MDTPDVIEVGPAVGEEGTDRMISYLHHLDPMRTVEWDESSKIKIEKPFVETGLLGFVDYFVSFGHNLEFDVKINFSMNKVLVLGAGLVGKAMAEDLAKDHEVTSVDFLQEPLDALSKNGINTIKADLRSADIPELVNSFDLVVGSVPGFMGHDILGKCIEAGKNVVDISFFPEEPWDLDEQARSKGVTAVVDCGVAPGMSNIIAGYMNSMMELNEFACYVGGLPSEPEWPWNYKAVFSPYDVIEEYVRPARIVEQGEIVVREALSEVEHLNFDQAGTLEAFNSDGLRTLLKTMDVPNMIEKTLRYPGTADLLRMMRDSGFFSQDQVEVEGGSVRPLDVTASLLFPKWKLKPGEREFTVMRVTGKGGGSKMEFNLFDEYDEDTDTTSMARTTGYTCNAVVNLLLDGKITEKGILPPEKLGSDHDLFKEIIAYLEARGVIYEWKDI